jgi:hypothetical protein
LRDCDSSEKRVVLAVVVFALDSIEARIHFSAVVDYTAGMRNSLSAGDSCTVERWVAGFGFAGISWASVRIVEVVVVDVDELSRRQVKQATHCERRFVECCHCFPTRRTGSLTRKTWLPVFSVQLKAGRCDDRVK